MCRFQLKVGSSSSDLGIRLCWRRRQLGQPGSCSPGPVSPSGKNACQTEAGDGLGYGTKQRLGRRSFHPWPLHVFNPISRKFHLNFFFFWFLLEGANIFFFPWNMNFLSVPHSSMIPGNIKELRQQNRMLSEHKDAGSFSLSHEIMVSATPLSQDYHHHQQPRGAGKTPHCYSVGLYAIFKPEMHLAFGDITISCDFVRVTVPQVFGGREQ